MSSLQGHLPTDRPERYAKQLAGHWSKRATAADVDGATMLTFENGRVLMMRPAGDRLDLQVQVPEGDDVERFAQVVKEHLERFGQRDELEVVWP